MLRNLEDFSLAENLEGDNPHWFSNDHIKAFAPLRKSLSKLSLVGCNIDATSEFKELSKLTYLNLSNTQINSESICELRSLKGLKVLQLANTEISDKGVEALLRELESLVDLNVLGCDNVSHTALSLKSLGLGKSGLVYLSNNRVGPRQ